MLGSLRELAAGLLDLLLPPICAACARATGGDVLCAACDVRSETALPDLPSPRPLVSWTAAVPHEDAARDWIARFKYPKRGLAGIDPAADAVVRYWIQRAARAAPGDPPDAVVPVPLHAKRLRERGFNQAELICRGLMDIDRKNNGKNFEFEKNLLIKIKDGEHQNPESYLFP